MYTRVCFRHNRANEIGTQWEAKPDMNTFMLWLKRPALVSHCDKCDEEINVRETIKALREREV